jgi:hypothetical protein
MLRPQLLFHDVSYHLSSTEDISNFPTMEITNDHANVLTKGFFYSKLSMDKLMMSSFLPPAGNRTAIVNSVA